MFSTSLNLANTLWEENGLGTLMYLLFVKCTNYSIKNCQHQILITNRSDIMFITGVNVLHLWLSGLLYEILTTSSLIKKNISVHKNMAD